MNRDEGLAVLSAKGWLAAAPVEFRKAILGCCRWRRMEAGEPISAGGDEHGDLIGLAEGVVAMTTILGLPETPVMHLAHAVTWFGHGPAVFGHARRVTATARTTVWLGCAPQAEIPRLLAGRPEWWRHVLPLALEYGDITLGMAADLLIRGGERRCAAVLLRLAGYDARHTDGAPREVPVTQDELAAACNLSANTTRAALRDLADKGLVSLGYRAITLRAPATLGAYIDR